MQKIALSGNGIHNPLNWGLVHRPLSYHSVLRCLCNKGFRGLTCYEKKVRHVKILARDMLRHASKPPPTAPRIWRCGMLRHAAACCGMLLPLVLVHKSTPKDTRCVFE